MTFFLLFLEFFKTGLFAIGGFLCCPQFEDFFSPGSTVHGKVEIAAPQPQRQEEVCRPPPHGPPPLCPFPCTGRWATVPPCPRILRGRPTCTLQATFPP